METDIGNSDQCQQHHKEPVASVFGSVNRFVDSGRRHDGEERVGHGCGQRPGQSDQHSSDDPDDSDQGKMPAGRSGPIRPVADCRKEKTDDHGLRESEDHFMRVP